MLFIPQPVISHLPGSSQVNFILYRVKGQVIRTFTEDSEQLVKSFVMKCVFFPAFGLGSKCNIWSVDRVWKSFERCQVPGIPTMWQHLPHCTKKEGLVKLPIPVWQWLQGLVNFCPGPMCTYMSTRTLRPCVIPYHCPCTSKYHILHDYIYERVLVPFDSVIVSKFSC